MWFGMIASFILGIGAYMLDVMLVNKFVASHPVDILDHIMVFTINICFLFSLIMTVSRMTLAHDLKAAMKEFGDEEYSPEKHWAELDAMQERYQAYKENKVNNPPPPFPRETIDENWG